MHVGTVAFCHETHCLENEQMKHLAEREMSMSRYALTARRRETGSYGRIHTAAPGNSPCLNAWVWYSSGDRCFCAGAVKTRSLFEYVFVLVTIRFRVSTLLNVLTLAL